LFGTVWQVPFWQVIGWPKLAQQLRVSRHDCPSLLQRQRPWSSFFFLWQMPVQHWRWCVQALSLPLPSPHGPSAEASRRRSC
jgi:hypothetical protein